MGDPFEDGVGSVVTTSVGRYDEVAVAIASVVTTIMELSLLELPPFPDIGVNPEAPDVLFHPSHDPSRRFLFQYAGHLVSLFGDGTLTIRPLDGQPCARFDGIPPGR